MRILIIDDEESIRKTATVLLREMGNETEGAGNRAEAFKLLEKGSFDVAFLDLKLNGENGMDILPDLLKESPQLQVVVFTAFASIENAVEAMRRGAADYLPKPFTPEQMRQVLRKVSKTRQLEDRVAELESRISIDSPNADLSTDEPAMQRVLTVAFKAAATPASIMILGDNGTGKTVLARAIHEASPQKDHAFITVSCPSLSRELLESELFGRVRGAYTGATADSWGKVAAADNGTLFLDEIGDLPSEIQPKLLRLLQEREYERVGEAKTRKANVRVVAATNRDLEKAVQEGRFREDLYYRLNVISVRLPPLRERPNDLKRLAAGYLRFFSAQMGKKVEGFSPDAEKFLLAYGWPGNLRELRNVVEHAMILVNGSQIQLEDLPDSLHRTTAAVPADANGLQVGMPVPLETIEDEHIRRVLAQTGSVDEAARVLGIGRATLYKKKNKIAP